MRVTFTASARADIKSIHEYIEENAGERKATEISTELRENCLGLSEMPDQFAMLEGYLQQGLHRRVYRNYLIVYRVHSEQVQIIRVFHGAQDYLRMLQQEFPNEETP